MLSTQRFREVGADGVNRFAGAVADMQAPWKGSRGKKVHRARRLMWIIGVVVGFLAVIGLLWGLNCQQESHRGDED